MSKKLRDALFKIGHILPETTQEIEEFDKIIKKKDLPSFVNNLSLPSEIVNKPFQLNSKMQKIKEGQASMARVAREGKEISKEVLAKMKADRANAEKKRE